MDLKLDIFGVKFSNLTLSKLVIEIASKVYSKEKLTISSPNVYICNYAKNNPEFKNLINKFSIVHPDGFGVFSASKFLYGKDGFFERSTGTELYFKLFKDYVSLKYFLVGGVEDCILRIYKNPLLYNHSNARNIVGNIYKPVNSTEDINIINESGADVLMVALGTPYQEEWIIQNKDKVNVPVIIAVGSGLDFLAGVKKRAPLWMQKIGLEWLYRLFQEPKRLWQRYIIGIPVFMFNIILIKVKLMLKKEST